MEKSVGSIHRPETQRWAFQTVDGGRRHITTLDTCCLTLHDRGIRHTVNAPRNPLHHPLEFLLLIHTCGYLNVASRAMAAGLSRKKRGKYGRNKRGGMMVRCTHPPIFLLHHYYLISVDSEYDTVVDGESTKE